MRQFSSKAKVSKANSIKSNKSICYCIGKLVYLTKDVELGQDCHNSVYLF